MRIDTVETKVYPFAELSATAQQAALESLHDINTDDSFWHESVIEDAKDVAKMLGIEVQDIFFSGFWSQGDGAQFTGTYSYAKQSAQAIKAEWPLDTELQLIADSLRDLQRRNFYSLSASVSSNGRYSHEMCTSISSYDSRSYYSDCNVNTDESLSELLRDFMRWIYKRLECDYEYLSSPDMVRESIEANEYEFTESGSMY